MKSEREGERKKDRDKRTTLAKEDRNVTAMNSNRSFRVRCFRVPSMMGIEMNLPKKRLFGPKRRKKA